MKKRRLMSLILAAAMLLSLIPAAAASETEYTDTISAEQSEFIERSPIAGEYMEEGGVLYFEREENPLSPEAAAHRELAAEALVDMYGYTWEAIERASYLHGDMNAFMRELSNLETIKEYAGIDGDTESDLLLLIANGYTNGQAISALVTGGMLTITTDNLAAAREEEIEAGLEKVRRERLGLPAAEEPEQDEELLRLSGKMGVPYAVIEEYRTNNGGLNLQTLESAFETAFASELLSEEETVQEERGSSGSSAGGGGPNQSTSSSSSDYYYTPEKILENPYSYENMGSLDVNLNSGAFTYSELDLSIPGVNGLDLNITRRYVSEFASNTIPMGLVYSSDLNYNKNVVRVRMQAYAVAGDGTLTLIPNINSYGVPNGILTSMNNLTQNFRVNDLDGAGAYFEYLRSMGLTTTSNNGPVMFSPVAEALSPYFANVIHNPDWANIYFLREYGIGDGWTLGFSSIQIEQDYYGTKSYWLITSEGKKYELDFYAPNGNFIVGYDLKDMRLTQGSSSGSGYTLTYKDGKKEYFNYDGRLTSIVDRYGNQITFSYTLTSGKVSKITITDTLNNIITYKNDNISTSTQTIASRPCNQRWSLNLNGTKVKEYYSYNNTANNTRELRVVSNENNEYTTHEYITPPLKFNAFSTSAQTNDGTQMWTVLRMVHYNYGSQTETGLTLSTENATRKLGTIGYEKYPRLASYNYTYLEGDGDVFWMQVKDYYYGDYTSVNVPGAYEPAYETKVKDQMVKPADDPTYPWLSALILDKQTINYSFNFEHLRYREEITDYVQIYDYAITNFGTGWYQDAITGSRMTQATVYAYNQYKLPSSISTTLYNVDSTAGTRTLNYSYTYDDRGNVLTSTAPNGQTTTYTYDSAYSIMLSAQYKQTSSTTIRVENTLTTGGNAGKNIAASIVKTGSAVSGKTEYAYATNGNLTSRKDYINSGSFVETQYVYLNGKAPVSEIKVLGIKDADGNSVTGSSGYSAGTAVTKYAYNARYLPTAITDPIGNVTGIQYDSVGRVTRVTNPDSSFASYAYNTLQRTVTMTDELGNATKYYYHFMGALEKAVDMQTNQVLLERGYDSFMRLVSETVHSSTGDDQTTYYVYDSRDRLTGTRKVSANGSIVYEESSVYKDGLGKLTSTVSGDANSPSIVTTRYTDNMGYVTKTGRYLGSTEYVDTYQYDYLGNVTQEKTAYTTSIGGSFTNIYTYDYAGRVLSVRNAENGMSYIEYDWLGRQTEFTDYRGSESLYMYDTLGRLLTEKHPIEQTGGTIRYAENRYAYDLNGNTVSVKTANNIPGAAASYNRTDYAYSNRNLLTKVSSYDGGSAVSHVQYYYDALGNMRRMYTGLTSPLTITGLDQVSGGSQGYSVTKYSYDHRSRLTSLIDPLGQTESYTYDINGSLRTKTDRNGNVTTNSYDSMGRLMSSNAGDTYVGYTYAKTGLERTETNALGTVTFTYDSLGRITGVSEYGNVVKTYGYNIGGLRTSLLAKRNNATILNTTYTYDNMGRLEQVREGGTLRATYSYDANGSRAGLTYPNGNVTDYTYNLSNWLTSLTNRNGSTVLSSYSYAYYSDGNQRSKTDHTGRVTTYAYDGLGRLSGESESTGFGAGYTYDAFGNRDSMTVTGAEPYTTAYDYDANNRLRDESKTVNGEIHTTAYYYDPNGNQISKTFEVLVPSGSGSASLSLGTGGVELYSYNGFNQLTEEYIDGATVSIAYRPDGLRNSKTSSAGTVTHMWDGSNIVADIQPGGSAEVYLRGNGLIMATGSGGTRYYVYNGHGDAVQLTGTNGAVTKSYDYDAFGVERAPDANDTNPFRYSGEYLDFETNTIYLRARYYNPTTGRFLTEDSARAGLNWYTYCNNNPILFIDPLGLDAVLINKPVDNVANKVGVEHMGGFFQDSNDAWWFFFWGDTVRYVQVEDASIFDSMDKMNKWLIDYRDPKDPDLRLLNPDNPYRDSVYVKGNFVASHNGALALLSAYDKSLETWDGNGLPNQEYNVATKNCGQVTMDLFKQGTLPSGTNVGNYMASNGYGNAVIPNWNMINMQAIFYNKSTNIAGFNTAMQTQRAKYEGKSDFTQWWYSGLRNNINAIS